MLKLLLVLVHSTKTVMCRTQVLGRGLSCRVLIAVLVQFVHSTLDLLVKLISFLIHFFCFSLLLFATIGINFGIGIPIGVLALIHVLPHTHSTIRLLLSLQHFQLLGLMLCLEFPNVRLMFSMEFLEAPLHDISGDNVEAVAKGALFLEVVDFLLLNVLGVGTVLSLEAFEDLWVPPVVTKAQVGQFILLPLLGDSANWLDLLQPRLPW